MAGLQVHYGMNSSVQVPVGYPVNGRSITLLPGHMYHVSLAVQATPPGTVIELLSGLWHVQKLLVKEFEPNLRANYTGETLGRLVVGAQPQGWQTLEATVVVRAALPGVGHNGTALQLRMSPPRSERNWGATVWLDAPSVVDAADLRS